MRLYWVPFPIENLRLAVETAKRILMKEKIDRQLAGQSSLSPFMNVRDRYNIKKVVTFDMQNRLDDKIYQLTSMINILIAQGSNQNKQFEPKIYQGKRRGQTRKCYDQGNYQNRYRSNSGDRKCRLGVELNMDRIIEEGHNMLTIIEMTSEEKVLEEHKIIEVKILEVEIEVTIETMILEEVEVDLKKGNIQVILEGMIKAVVIDQDQV